MMSQLIIFDTTLRDGEQSPGASMTHDEKLLLAKQLERLGVDVIEAGFPAASMGDFEAVADIAKTIKTVRSAAWRAPLKTISKKPGKPSATPTGAEYTPLLPPRPCIWRRSCALRQSRSLSAP